jgi:cytochrome P450
LQETKRLLGEGLLTSEGRFHRRQRRTIQPIFHHERISTYADAMARSAARVADRWRDDDVVDMHAEMSALTLAVVGRTLFDTDVGEREARRSARRWGPRSSCSTVSSGPS